MSLADVWAAAAVAAAARLLYTKLVSVARQLVVVVVVVVVDELALFSESDEKLMSGHASSSLSFTRCCWTLWSWEEEEEEEEHDSSPLSKWLDDNLSRTSGCTWKQSTNVYASDVSCVAPLCRWPKSMTFVFVLCCSRVGVCSWTRLDV